MSVKQWFFFLSFLVALGVGLGLVANAAFGAPGAHLQLGRAADRAYRADSVAVVATPPIRECRDEMIDIQKLQSDRNAMVIDVHNDRDYGFITYHTRDGKLVRYLLAFETRVVADKHARIYKRCDVITKSGVPLRGIIYVFTATSDGAPT